MTANIGFLGLGQMGAAIAERLEATNTQLHVHDPIAANVAPFVDRGAHGYSAARGVADAAEIVFACLPSPKVSMAVADEVAQGSALSIYVEMSTIGRAAIECIGSVLQPKGIAVIDAPVSGGPDGARNGRLAVMAAGDAAALDRVRAFLVRIAGALFEVGDTPGLGQTMKLVNNLLAAANIALTTEAAMVGAKAGLDPEIMMRVLNASSGQNSVTTGLFPNYVLNGRFNFGATVATMLKDVELGLSEAKNLGLPMVAMVAVAAAWRTCLAQVGPDEDLTWFVRAQEERARVQIRSGPPKLTS